MMHAEFLQMFEVLYVINLTGETLSIAIEE